MTEIPKIIECDVLLIVGGIGRRDSSATTSAGRELNIVIVPRP
jgi:hypothetical protein